MLARTEQIARELLVPCARADGRVARDRQFEIGRGRHLHPGMRRIPSPTRADSTARFGDEAADGYPCVRLHLDALHGGATKLIVRHAEHWLEGQLSRPIDGSIEIGRVPMNDSLHRRRERRRTGDAERYARFIETIGTRDSLRLLEPENAGVGTRSGRCNCFAVVPRRREDVLPKGPAVIGAPLTLGAAWRCP